MICTTYYLVYVQKCNMKRQEFKSMRKEQGESAVLGDHYSQSSRPETTYKNGESGIHF